VWLIITTTASWELSLANCAIIVLALILTRIISDSILEEGCLP
jgi:hypothetical protein